MLIKIRIKGDSGFFYGNTDGIDLASGEIYKSNIMPCKTTILGMLCYYYGIEFGNLDEQEEELKYTFIHDFYYGILNKSNSITKETKKYTSDYNRTVAGRKQLFVKEYIKNIEFDLYIYIKPESLLENYIQSNIENKVQTDTPGLGDKNLFPDIFEVEVLNNNSISITDNFNGKLLTNMFKADGKYFIALGNNYKNFLLSYNRLDYNNNKLDFIIGTELYDFDFHIENENVAIIDNKGILLY